MQEDRGFERPAAPTVRAACHALQCAVGLHKCSPLMPACPAALRWRCCAGGGCAGGGCADCGVQHRNTHRMCVYAHTCDIEAVQRCINQFRDATDIKELRLIYGTMHNSSTQAHCHAILARVSLHLAIPCCCCSMYASPAACAQHLFTCVVLPVRQASKAYDLASALVDAAIAGLANSRSGSTTCTLAPSLEHVTETCCEASWGSTGRTRTTTCRCQQVVRSGDCLQGAAVRGEAADAHEGVPGSCSVPAPPPPAAVPPQLVLLHLPASELAYDAAPHSLKAPSSSSRIAGMNTQNADDMPAGALHQTLSARGWQKEQFTNSGQTLVKRHIVE